MRKTIERAVSGVVSPHNYWAVKGFGRILLVVAICVYGVGLIMSRIAKERRQAICERDGEAVIEVRDQSDG